MARRFAEWVTEEVSMQACRGSAGRKRWGSRKSLREGSEYNPTSGGFQAWACSFLKGRQGLDRLAGFLLDKAQLIELLQVEPELRTGAEEVAQAQGRIAGDGPPAVQNLAQVRE